ncbi:hypothetical protein D3C81_2328830 [compost metagenome]
MRKLSRKLVQGKSKGFIGIGPGAAQIRMSAAIGVKSARKCVVLLSTRMFC